MDENNILKKKSKKNYYHQNHNQNKYYYKKKKKKKTLNNPPVDDNILLFNNHEKKPPQVIKENSQDYEEVDITPVKRGEKIYKFFGNSILRFSLVLVLLFIFIIGGTYAYFNYTRVEQRQANIAAGDVYVKLVEDTASITLPKMYPREDNAAREIDGNYIDFTIKGKNTSTITPIIYTIYIENAEDIPDKTRIDSKYIKVDLQEKIDDEYYYVIEGLSLDEYSFSNSIPVNTIDEITREYRMRFWISDEVLVSDYDSNATFTEKEFNNLFATYDIKIDSYDEGN